MTGEIWKPISELNGKYAISNYGRVKSFCKNKNGHIMKPSKSQTGHYQYGLNGKTFFAHRLVKTNFYGPQPTKKHECCHNDGNPGNNHISNLRWGTRKENVADLKKHGTVMYGKRNHATKLTPEQVLKIRSLRGKAIQNTLAKQYGVSKSLISQIMHKQIWAHLELGTTQRTAKDSK